MARNKYPQETVDRILDTAQTLFLRQGYEHTTIQDIIDHLGGLTKGAIYHHFKSKEEIYAAVMDRLFATKGERMDAILNRRDLTGREKLVATMWDSLEDPNQDQVFESAPNLARNPYLLTRFLEDVFYSTPQEVLGPLMEEGVADGSISTDQPRELAQVLSLLFNVWLNPTLFHGSKEELASRARLLNTLLAPFGLDLLSPQVVENVLRYQAMYTHKNPGEPG